MRRHDITICIALAASACSSQSDTTGSYIASDANGAFMVQIVSVLDGRVAGTLSILSVKPNGRIDAVRKPFSGTLERDAINITIENGTGVSLITGRLAGRTMDLTFFANGASQRLSFEKNQASRFDQLAAELRTRAAGNAASTEQAEAARRDAREKEAATTVRIEGRASTQRDIDRLTDEAAKMTETVRTKTDRIDAVIAGYRSLSEQAQRGKASKSGKPMRSSEIDDRLESMDDQARNVHEQVVDFSVATKQALENASRKGADHLTQCGSDPLLTCSRQTAAIKALLSSYAVFQAASLRELEAFDARDIR